jgi:metacaspase-1
MGHTLFLLMSALKSENFTAILDSCYSGGAVRNFLVRARDNKDKKVEISPNEKAYQEQWLSRLNLSPEKFVEAYRKGVAKGVVLAATNPTQTAIDASLDGFFAGAFTYLLTQHLWQKTGTPDSAISYIIPNLPKDFNQTPRYEVKVGSGYEKQPIYFINPPNPAADAVITEVKGNQAKLWLGGIDVDAIAPGMVFNIINGKGKVTLQSRDSANGLIGVATVQGAAKPGLLLKVEK